MSEQWELEMLKVTVALMEKVKQDGLTPEELVAALLSPTTEKAVAFRQEYERACLHLTPGQRVAVAVELLTGAAGYMRQEEQL